MRSNHLTDEEIQTLLSVKNGRFPPDVKGHLESCERCMSRLRTYEQLFSALSRDPDYRVSRAVLQRLIHRLPERSTTTRLFPTTETILISAIIAAALGVSCFFVDFNPILGWIQRLTLPRLVFNFRMVESITPLLERLGGLLGLLPFIALVFIMVGLMDRLIKRIRHSHFMI